VRAYLRGATTVNAPLIDQIRAILSDEGMSEGDFSARSVPWQEWLNATKSMHAQMRDELRDMVSLGLSDGSAGTALTDASELVSAALRLASGGQLDPVGSETRSLNEPYLRAYEIAGHWDGKRLERIEYEQVKDRAAKLATYLRGNNIKTHFDRLNHCITGIATQLPTAAPDRVTIWRQSYTRIDAQLQEAGTSHVEDLIVNLEDGNIPRGNLKRLCWLSSVPARDLQDFLTLAQIGEQTVDALSPHVRDCVRDAHGVGTLAEIKDIGRRLCAAVGGASSKESSQ